MQRMIPCLLLLACGLAHASTAAAEAAMQFTAPNLRAPDDPDVNGMRFSLLHGDGERIRGVDVGILSLSESTEVSGLRVAMGVSRLRGDLEGVDLSLVNVHSGHDRGVNAAFVNRLNDMRDGVNLSFLNIADGATTLDIGGLNLSDESRLQLGFINVTNRITSLQFGFLNIAKNGFLPVFPIFNFPKE